MRPTREFTAEHAARDGRGLHYKSREWAEIASHADWAGAWPEIDRSGRLTGNEIGSVGGGWLNVDDAAMIPVAEAVAGGWPYDRDEGRAWPPMHVRVNQPQID